MKRILALFFCLMFILMFGSITSEVFAACPDGSGNCDISGEYQINGSRALKVQLGNSIPRDIFIGDGAGNKNPVSDGRAYGDILVGRHAGYSLERMIDFNNIGASTIIGDLAGKYLSGSVHNTYIGAGSNGVTCSGLPCAAEVIPMYNTGIGSMSGLMNIGDFNNFVGTEAGKMLTTGSKNIFIGVNAGAGHYVDIDRSLTTGNDNIHIGFQTEALSGDLSSTIALGNYARVEESNQIVVGSYNPELGDEGQSGLFRDSYWGSGATSTSPQDFSFNATGGRGSNISGANLVIAGGKSTGNAIGGNIILQTSPSASSGSNQNSLKDRMVIDSNGNVTIGDGSASVAPWLSFDALYDDCGLSYNSGSDWIYMNCGIWPEIVYLRGSQAWLDSPAPGTLRSKANTQLNLQSPIIYLTGTDNNGTPNDGNVKVGIGTSNPQSKLAVSGLPNTPPDSSGTRGIVCITNDGNMWIDDDGDSNICQ